MHFSHPSRKIRFKRRAKMVHICWIFYCLVIIYSVTSEISNRIIDCDWYDTSKLQFQCGWVVVENSGPFFGENNSINCDGGQLVQYKSSFDSIEFLKCRFSVFYINIFKLYGNIRKMNLSSVDLESLRWQNFIHADHLEILDVSNNRLREIPAMLFDGAPELNEINFSNNQLSLIDPRAFEHSTADHLNKLAKLDLSHNKIDLIDSRTFAALTTLKSLNLSCNYIHVIEADIFAQNKELKVLQLRFNRIMKFTCNYFENLKQLDLSHNFLNEIDTSCLRKGGYIDLNIENNKYLTEKMINLPDVETIAFAYIKPMEYVLFMFGLVVLSILCVILPRKTAPFLTLNNADVEI